MGWATRALGELVTQSVTHLIEQPTTVRKERKEEGMKLEMKLGYFVSEMELLRMMSLAAYAAMDQKVKEDEVMARDLAMGIAQSLVFLAREGRVRG